MRMKIENKQIELERSLLVDKCPNQYKQILQYSNAFSVKSVQNISNFGKIIFQKPPSSPDLAPNNYHPFRKYSLESKPYTNLNAVKNDIGKMP